MEEMHRCMLLGLLTGLWLSWGEVQCNNSGNENPSRCIWPFCCKTSSVKTCSKICRIHQQPGGASQTRDEACVDSENVLSLPSWVYSDEFHHRYTCELSGAAINSEINSGYGSNASENKWVEFALGNKTAALKVDDAKLDSKSWRCNCDQSCCTVCRKDTPTIKTSTTTPSTTIIMTNTHDGSSRRTYTSYGSTAAASIGIAKKTDSTTSFRTQESTNGFSDDQTGQLNSPNTIIILLILLLFLVVVIIAGVVLFMRKRKFDKRNEWSPTTYTPQGETVTNVYADNGTSGGTAPARNHIFDELDMMTLDPTPSNVYSTQPTSVAVDMGRSADYVDIDLPMKDQQKPMNISNAPLSLSPVYSQPFEPETSASNTEYAEPFKPDTTNAATAPIPNHNNATGDQQNDVYSLAKAIPLSDPNVIYSQPNKPLKSTGPTDESGGSTDPIHSEATGVEPGAESRGSATQDPNAVYAEPMKLKKSS